MHNVLLHRYFGPISSGFHLDSLTYVLFQSSIPPPPKDGGDVPSAYKHTKQAFF